MIDSFQKNRRKLKLNVNPQKTTVWIFIQGVHFLQNKKNIKKELSFNVREKELTPADDRNMNFVNACKITTWNLFQIFLVTDWLASADLKDAFNMYFSLITDRHVSYLTETSFLNMWECWMYIQMEFVYSLMRSSLLSSIYKIKVTSLSRMFMK